MNIDMTRHQGATGLKVAECIDQRFGTWRVRTDFQPDMEEDGKTQRGVTFIEAEYPYKPTLQEVKAFVLGVIDAETDVKIQSGLIWHCKATDDDIPVWLSKENQLNFKAAYDLAVQKQGATLPVTFKMGEREDGTPVYHTFGTMEDAEDFYTTAVAYVQKCLVEGWRKKDGFDFTPYEEELN